MRSVGIRFVGGPADGKEFIIPGDPMDPPETCQVFHPGPSGILPITYRREVNPEDEGPLWLYRHTEGDECESE